jgi:large subunit ribosomal protein L10
MPKTKQEKNEIIEDITKALQDNPVIIITDYKGIPNDQMQELRNQLKEVDAQLMVVKNTLFNIALKKAGLEIDEEILNRPLMLAVSKDVASAKTIDGQKEEMENLEVLGGIYEEEYREREYIEKLAKIPSKEELLVQLIGQLKAPQYGLVYSLKGNLQKLLMILDQLSKQPSSAKATDDVKIQHK